VLTQTTLVLFFIPYLYLFPGVLAAAARTQHRYGLAAGRVRRVVFSIVLGFVPSR